MAEACGPALIGGKQSFEWILSASDRTISPAYAATPD
jgi:hypothetical protein